MTNEHERTMRDLHRLIGQQEFESEAEMRTFLDGLMGKKLPSLPQSALTSAERAQALVSDAHALPVEQAMDKVLEALDLDPDCIEAYEYLGLDAIVPTIATAFFEKGIAIGRKKFSGESGKLEEGTFWIAHETRPFMRCMLYHAECLHEIGKIAESIEVMEEMIRLNPNDNQGARDELMLYLIQIGEYQKYLRYSDQYKEDCGSFPVFNHALYMFKTEGASEAANAALKAAMDQNPFTAAKLLSKTPIPELPVYCGIGDQNEATMIAYYSWPLWHQTPGAIPWMKKLSVKR